MYCTYGKKGTVFTYFDNTNSLIHLCSQMPTCDPFTMQVGTILIYMNQSSLCQAHKGGMSLHQHLLLQSQPKLMKARKLLLDLMMSSECIVHINRGELISVTLLVSIWIVGSAPYMVELEVLYKGLFLILSTLQMSFTEKPCLQHIVSICTQNMLNKSLSYCNCSNLR